MTSGDCTAQELVEVGQAASTEHHGVTENNCAICEKPESEGLSVLC